MSNKTIVYIGGGASALTSAILLKKRMPLFDITIVEKEKKLGKKLSATGGGKCNIAPACDDIFMYNMSAQDVVDKLFKEISLSNYLTLLSEIGVNCKTIKDYGYYPVHESAPQLVKNLYHQLNVLGIKVIYDELEDYVENKDNVLVKLKTQELTCNHLIISTGGLGTSDIREILDKHGVKYTNLCPGLAPIKVKEDVSTLFGCRFEANISLKYNGELIKEYFGEVQFKKDAISGIPALNLSSEISRRQIKDNGDLSRYSIHIGLKDISSNFVLDKTVEEALLSLFKEEYARYLINNNQLNPKEIIDSNNYQKILDIISNQSFIVKSLYDFKDGQVTVGGILLDEVDENFRRNNVFYIGELLDVDGSCGGYNLRFAITSGFKAALSLLKSY